MSMVRKINFLFFVVFSFWWPLPLEGLRLSPFGFVSFGTLFVIKETNSLTMR